MANYQLGSGFISIFPEMKGMRKSISGGLGKAAEEGGRKFSRIFDRMGTTVGSGVGEKFGRAFASSTTSDIENTLESAAQKAHAAHRKAKDRLLDQQGKVRALEKALTETREKYGAESAKTVAAEERLAAATRRLKSERVSLSAAELRAASAQKAVTEHAAATAKQTTSLADSFKKAASQAGGFFTQLPGLGQAASTAGKHFGQISQTVQKTASGLRQAFTREMAALPAPVQSLARNIGGALSSIPAHAANMARSLGTAASAGLRGLHSAFSSTFKSLASAASAAGLAIATGITSHLGQSAKRVDTLNAFPKVMQNLGYTADEASSSIASITKYFDAGLPGSLDEMASAVQKFAPIMLGMGKSLDETTAFTMAFNDALLASGKGSEAVTRGMEQYAQILSTGKVDLESWKILQEVMPGQLTQMAKALLGPTANMGNLYEALQTGQVSLQDFNDTILRLDKEGGDGFASFAKQAQDATGGILTSVSKIGVGFTKAGASILNAIGAENISRAADLVKHAIESIGSSIASAISALKNFGANMGGVALAGLIPIIGGAVGALGGLAAKIPIIGSALGFLSGPVGVVLGLFAAMWTQSQTLRDALSGIGQSLQTSLGGALTTLEPVLNTLVTALGNTVGVLGDTVGAVLAGLAPVIPPLVEQFAALGNALGGVFAAALNMVTPLLPALGQAVLGIGQAIAGVLGPALAMGASLIQSLVPVLQQIGAAIMPALSAAIGSVSAILPQVSNALGGVLKSVGQLIPPLVSIIGSILPPLASAFASVIPPIVSVASSIVGTVIPALANIISWITRVVASVVSAAARAVSVVSSARSSVVGILSNLPAVVSAALSGMRSILIGVGKNMVSGLLAGIGNFGALVAAKLRSGLASAIASVRSFLQIGSPSRLLASNVGRWIPAGVALGVEQGTPSMLDTVREELNRVSSIGVNPPPLNFKAEYSSYREPDALARSNIPTYGVGSTMNIYVQATDPASVASVIEARQRQLLGA